jgi:hypothetical protein
MAPPFLAQFPFTLDKVIVGSASPIKYNFCTGFVIAFAIVFLP